MSSKFLIVIGGPTAIGKTDIAIQLAKYFNTVILSADSRQVYKELNIGVAKPTEKQLNEVKHYFISHKSILEDYSAYDYQKDVHQLLPELFKTLNYVIMVGGTGFYINAVLNGLNEIPTISDETKEKVLNFYNKN
jgi:tRNA dimethylallyltransferase